MSYRPKYINNGQEVGLPVDAETVCGKSLDSADTLSDTNDVIPNSKQVKDYVDRAGGVGTLNIADNAVIPDKLSFHLYKHSIQILAETNEQARFPVYISMEIITTLASLTLTEVIAYISNGFHSSVDTALRVFGYEVFEHEEKYPIDGIYYLGNALHIVLMDELEGREYITKSITGASIVAPNPTVLF